MSSSHSEKIDKLVLVCMEHDRIFFSIVVLMYSITDIRSKMMALQDAAMTTTVLHKMLFVINTKELDIQIF